MLGIEHTLGQAARHCKQAVAAMKAKQPAATVSRSCWLLDTPHTGKLMLRKTALTVNVYSACEK